ILMMVPFSSRITCWTSPRRRLARPSDRGIRFADDSPLEGDGFELSIPGSRDSQTLWETDWLSRKRSGSGGEPMVGIHLPPARSRANSQAQASRPAPHSAFGSPGECRFRRTSGKRLAQAGLKIRYV